jgi:phenylpyruvate tautomerase PptA (4-oxalocrotonate tautomerase family)
MPLLRVTHTKGAFTESQRDELAERFTHAILVGEIGNDNPTARSVAYVQFLELDGAEGGWYVGGKREPTPPEGGRMIFDIFYPVGAADQGAKTQLHRDLSEAVGAVLGVNVAFPNRPQDWIFVHEIPEGNWGISTRTVGVETIHAFTQGSPERVPYHHALLAAQKRERDAFNYPAGAPGTGQPSPLRDLEAAA